MLTTPGMSNDINTPEVQGVPEAFQIVFARLPRVVVAVVRLAVTALIHDHDSTAAVAYPLRDRVVGVGLHQHAVQEYDRLSASITPIAKAKPQPVKHHELVTHPAHIARSGVFLRAPSGCSALIRGGYPPGRVAISPTGAMPHPS